ncbi:hypothetical protein [Aquimarina sp. RZ0]|uniref:hypothetical protein n=1 Tax=Aquimarina sp. RZ0 TaxID=2607730 RepID=UPI0011F22ADF|nr:hypothetical protein [Aquimarina sp. RZ0]KAA1246792.1 hypothetical protein F0000_05900 [Aquimarina sp. RZ0]
MNKKFLFFLLVLNFAFLGCKNTINQVKEADHYENISSDKKSFVISCGSGCAVTYIEKNIVKSKSKVNIFFEVISYMNDKQHESSEQQITINVENSKIKSIQNEIDGNYESLNKEDNIYLEIKKNYSDLIKSKEINYSEVISKNTASFEEIIGSKLVGLSIISDTISNPYQKYGLDFSTTCYCDAPSFYIDKKRMEIIAFNYCDTGKIPHNLEHSYKYKIVTTESSARKITVTTTLSLNFTFTKIKDLPIYELEIEGELPTEYIGNNLKKVFTSQPDKFKSYDCGDFDG